MYRTPELKIDIKDSMGAQAVHVLLARALERITKMKQSNFGLA